MVSIQQERLNGVFMKKIIFLLSLSACFVQPSESFNQKTWPAKIMGFIGQSSQMHAYSTHIQTNIDKLTTQLMLRYGNEPASQKYQELGTQAQFAVGIPKEHHLPIKKMNLDSPFTKMVGAIAEAGAIYVNEEKLDKRTHGQNYAALCHEAVHAKYHDKAVDSMSEMVGFIGTAIGTHAVLKTLNVVAWRKRLSFVVACGLTGYASSKYSHFREQRADIEGHYATQCSSCVFEHAQLRKQLFEKENNPLKNSGYLCFADLEKIAQNLGDKKCSYHFQE